MSAFRLLQAPTIAWPRQTHSSGLHEPAPASLGPRGPPQLLGALLARARSSSSSALSLDLVARPCPRHGPQSLADGFRPLVQTPPEARSPWAGRGRRWAARALRPDEPPDAGALDQRQALRWQRKLDQRQAAPATGACAREGRAVAWRQLPRALTLRPRHGPDIDRGSDRGNPHRGMSQGGRTAFRLRR